MRACKVGRIFAKIGGHMVAVPHSFGALLKVWRRARGVSQLELATEAGISQKHLSFMESGRSSPSREMLLLLARHLEVPLRDRNALLLSAGFAPVFEERGLDDASLAEARRALELIIKGHDPYPALALDRHWNMVSANTAVTHLLEGVDPELLKPPVNVIRLSLDPRGIAPRILNLSEWRSHLLERLRRQYRLTRDPVAQALIREYSESQPPECISIEPAEHSMSAVVVPLRLATSVGVLSLFSTTTVFGTPVEITLSELSLEAFYPADASTGEILRRFAQTP